MELLESLGLVWRSASRASDSRSPGPFVYGSECGPSSWRCAYPAARGCEQSPVNVVERAATVILGAKRPLVFRRYCDEPVSASLANDGNTVVLGAQWACGIRPWLEGGPLTSIYQFRSASFRWGPADDEGSEHSIDYVRFPLELQVSHVKRGFDLDAKSRDCKPRDGLAIVSYFFQITSVDNPYLEHVVTNLWRVSCPGTCVSVPAFPLEWLFPSFERKYYSYSGSLTHPPCSEIVTWILHPQPIAISHNQMTEFRKVCSKEGPILCNSRPVQKLNDRQIFYYA